MSAPSSPARAACSERDEDGFDLNVESQAPDDQAVMSYFRKQMKQDDAHAAPDAEAVALQSQAIFENIPYEQVRLPGFKMPPEPQSSSSSSTLRPSPATIARRQKLRDLAQRQATKKLRLLDFLAWAGNLNVVSSR